MPTQKLLEKYVVKRFAARTRRFVDAVGLWLSGVMLPQLHPGVGPRGPRGQERQGPAIAVDGQDRARREVHADADDR